MSNDREVEVNLRIPSLVIKSVDAPSKTVNNTEFRFIKQMTLGALPKVGDALDLSIANGATFQANVNRVKWDDSKHRFVLDCRWAARGISASDYEAIRGDPAWTMKHLLE
jgi:hypothetical protein